MKAVARRVVRPSVAHAVALVTVALSVGCAGKRPGGASAVTKPAEFVTLAELQPTVTLPPAPKTAATPVSPDALEAYARGRDALLRNQKPAAQKYLNEAAGIEPDSALVWRDLGYAQLGRDDAKAAVAFRRACANDPNDADSRLQLARLSLAANKNDEAITQLRLARLTEDFRNDDGLAAVVDLLLGQSLEQSHYRTAALECYEHVLALVDDGDLNLRGRPELTDVLQRPAVLVLRVADLATQCGQNQRAIALYQRLREQEPQLALMMELRLARAELANGDTTTGVARAFAFVRQSNASVLSLALFDECFAQSGGASAALKVLDGAPATQPTNLDEQAACLAILRSHLQLGQGDASAAAETLRSTWPSNPKQPINDKLWLARVRQTARVYRALKSTDALVRQLLRETADAPARWNVTVRGWTILTQPAQAKPFRASDLVAMDLSGESKQMLAARDFVLSFLYAGEGRRTASKQAADAAAKAGFDAAALAASPPIELPAADASTSKELAVIFDDYRDDPDLLTTIIAGLLRGGQQRMVIDALASVHAARPADVVITTAYAQILVGSEQRTEANAVLDRTVQKVSSAPELYALASQYSGLNDEKSAERVLRLAYAKDPSSPSVCNDLGYLLADKGRELAFAEQLLTTACRDEPDNPAYLDSLGWLLYKRSKFAAAAERLEEAVALSDPADPVVLDHAGDALYRADQADKARGRWQQAVDAIKDRGSTDPQLRLRVEQKLRQLNEKTPVVVAPVAGPNEGE